MTTTRSIFQKVCPGCMATVALDSRQCSCGHAFDHDDTDADLSSEEIRLKAEELYENYLAARAEQATSAARSARSDYSRDPSNKDKSDRVADAMHESKLAEAALAAQSARVAEMKMALPPAKPSVHIPAPSVPKQISVPPPKPVAAMEPVRTVRKSAPAVVASAVRPAPVRMKRAKKTDAKTPSRSHANPVSTPAKARHPHPVQTAVPNPAFRQAQAARAEKILLEEQRSEKTAVAAAEPVTNKVEKTSAPLPKPKVLPVASHPTKNAPRLYALNKKDCPNCTASVGSDATRCRCGYEFSSSESHIPPLVMSDEERAELSKLFNTP